MTIVGDHIRTIGEGVIDAEVVGVAASTDMIAACTCSKVFLFDINDGRLLRSFGEEGEAEGQLKGCAGLRFTPDGGHVLIVEGNNNRLSLFTLTGVFVRCIGVGKLDGPSDVAFISTGDIAVVDTRVNRVSVFSADASRPVLTVGSEGDGPGQFKSPVALAVHGDTLFVLDQGSARVQVLKCE